MGLEGPLWVAAELPPSLILSQTLHPSPHSQRLPPTHTHTQVFDRQSPTTSNYPHHQQVPVLHQLPLPEDLRFQNVHLAARVYAPSFALGLLGPSLNQPGAANPPQTSSNTRQRLSITASGGSWSEREAGRECSRAPVIDEAAVDFRPLAAPSGSAPVVYASRDAIQSRLKQESSGSLWRSICCIFNEKLLHLLLPASSEAKASS